MINNTELGVSTWSLHHRLGTYYSDAGGVRRAELIWGTGNASLIDVIGEAAENGFGAIEICHFHLPDRSDEYLQQVKTQCAQSKVRILALLIDDGDIINPDPDVRSADFAMIAEWIRIAGVLGAERVRISAGHQESPADGPVLQQSAHQLLELAKLGESLGVAVETENWHALLSGPDQVTRLMELTKGSIGFKLDFGNWPNNRKYMDLPKVAQYATSTHAKSHYNGDTLDVEDFLRCCDICKDAGFTGPHVLVYDGPGDEWERLREIAALILPYLARAQSV